MSSGKYPGKCKGSRRCSRSVFEAKRDVDMYYCIMYVRCMRSARCSMRQESLRSAFLVCTVHAHCTYLLKTGQHWRCIACSEDVLPISVPMIQCNIRASGVKVKTHLVHCSVCGKSEQCTLKNAQIWVYNGEKKKSNLKSKYFIKSSLCKIWMQTAKN